MCGIAGFINYGKVDRERLLKDMSDAVAHRGPDGDGVFLDDSAGLAHRRLAIIDLDAGDQPMRSSDGRYVTVFNGEIYNYREIREKLKRENREFRTNSDTEVIAESIRTWGVEKACREFRGMFAFACYDKKSRKLFLARDRTGIKPLYFAVVKESVSNGYALFFASEQKALLRIPQLPREINPVALHDTLTLGFPVTPQTCWKHVQMFPPANFAEIDLANFAESGDLQTSRYWRWKYTPEKISFEDALEEIQRILRNSLKFHLRSDVPLASFLSGGIDSSLLVALMSKSGLVDNLRTFNVGFDDEKYDESSDAAHVATISKTAHQEIRMKGGQGDPEVFERILSQYDEPYGDSSCLPTYLISREMRAHVKVVISGDGGDELFGGYDRFINVAKLAKIRSLPFKRLFSKALATAIPFAGPDRVRRLRNALRVADGSDSALFCGLHTYFSEFDKTSLYNPEFAGSANSTGATWERFAHFIPSEGNDIRSRLMDTENALNLHADYLRKVDIASSAHGLEVRVPFLDAEVMDFAARLPMDLKIRNGTMKYLLRELARKVISDRIADKSKWGFGIPFDSWCGDDMMNYLRDLLFGSEKENMFWMLFNREYVERLWKMFTEPSSANFAKISRFQIYQRIFLLASVKIWLNKWNPEL